MRRALVPMALNVLPVVLATLWLISYVGGVRLQVHVGERINVLRFARGSIDADFMDDMSGMRGANAFGFALLSVSELDRGYFDSSYRPHQFEWAGIGFAYTFGSLRLRLPMWFAFLACTAVCIAILRRHRRRAMRAVLRQCTHCGYDLRASRDRCPECGTAIQPAAPNPATPAVPARS